MSSRRASTVGAPTAYRRKILPWHRFHRRASHPPLGMNCYSFRTEKQFYLPSCVISLVQSFRIEGKALLPPLKSACQRGSVRSSKKEVLLIPFDITCSKLCSLEHLSRKMVRFPPYSVEFLFRITGSNKSSDGKLSPLPNTGLQCNEGRFLICLRYEQRIENQHNYTPCLEFHLIAR